VARCWASHCPGSQTFDASAPRAFGAWLFSAPLANATPADHLPVIPCVTVGSYYPRVQASRRQAILTIFLLLQALRKLSHHAEMPDVPARRLRNETQITREPAAPINEKSARKGLVDKPIEFPARGSFNPFEPKPSSPVRHIGFAPTASAGCPPRAAIVPLAYASRFHTAGTANAAACPCRPVAQCRLPSP